MISVKDCADSTIEIVTDIEFDDKCLERVKELIQFIYDTRENHFILGEAVSEVNNEEEDDTIN